MKLRRHLDYWEHRLDQVTEWTTQKAGIGEYHFDRLWAPLGDLDERFAGWRLALHRMPVPEDAQLRLHNHPWPFIVRIVSGAYEMAVASGLGTLGSPPPVHATFQLHAGTHYEYLDSTPWHSIRPLTRTTTVMLWLPVDGLQSLPSLPETEEPGPRPNLPVALDDLFCAHYRV